ncbi:MULTISPECIES: hypothetical protein [Bacteria]|uniref:hypothetical protein n=1 Tax=Bacteria TaxID=2 RepID=UPI003624F15F
MKMKLFFSVMLLAAFIGCKEEEQKTPPAEAINTTTQKVEAKTDSLKVNPAHGLPGHRCDLPVGAPLNSATANQTPVSKLPSTSVSPIRLDKTPELNPPHGEPYHDCSIPVGAKLKKG